MTDYVTPCARPENDPEDWFIEKDGKQYADDDLVPAWLKEAAAAAHAAGHIEAEELLGILEDAEQAAKTAALLRRRHAKDKCHTDCYLRHQCLGLALDGPNGVDIAFGTKGGYYPEELRAIDKEREARRARRRSGS